MKTRSAPADQRGFLCDFSFVIMNKSKAKSPLCDERDNMCGKSGTVHLYRTKKKEEKINFLVSVWLRKQRYSSSCHCISLR